MAMVADAFAELFVKKLADLIQDRAAMMLGVGEDLQQLKASLEKVICVLKDAERRRIEDSAINSWLSDLKDVMYEADDIIDLCRTHKHGRSVGLLEDEQYSASAGRPSVRCCISLPSCFGCGSSIHFRYQIGIKIRNLNGRLQKLSDDNLSFKLVSVNPQPVIRITNKSSPLVDPDVLGKNIVDDTKRMVELLNEQNGQRCRLFAITGMGGIGKTTLAQSIFNDQSMKDNYEIRMWACVSQKFSEIDLLKQLIRCAGMDHGQATERAELELMLRAAIEAKRVLLVLDDVWQADVWVNLLCAPLSSREFVRRILITTRDENVARKMGAEYIYRVNLLPKEQGWELLCRSSLLKDEEEIQNLKGVGLEIVRKCKGLPLAIKTVGGVLRAKEKSPREWEKVLSNGAWSMSKLPEELRGALYLSYEDLPSHLKQCFLYFALFPEDYVFILEKLVSTWVSEGFVEKDGDRLLEETGKEYFEELMRRSILQPGEMHAVSSDTCTMHDLLRSLAILLAADECFSADAQSIINFPAKHKFRRLSILAKGGASDVIIPDLILEQNNLRTLIVHNISTSIKDDSFVRLQHLRFLSLRGTETRSLPDSIGNLIHLRHLDLSCTRVSMLPETVGKLTNLQVLGLRGCKNLYTLPQGITRLYNLRCLYAVFTPLEYLPKGISELRQLNALTGFAVSDRSSCGRICDLEELKSLNLLRVLLLTKLERAMNVTPILWDKTCLEVLVLHCNKREIERPYSVEETIRIEHVFSKLCPPPCLNELRIYNYFGRVNPRWMESATCLPHLTFLVLFGCASCPQLPPLGELPNLRYLRIEGADAVVSIGSEFLGNGARDINGNHFKTSIAFPKLKTLIMRKMVNWEQWSLYQGRARGGVSNGGATTTLSHQLALPHLELLELSDCPKLRSLPQGLHQAAKMKSLFIEGAHELKVIEKLPTLSGTLEVRNGSCLERISDLATLKELKLIECPAVKCVEGLDVLRLLHLKDAAMESLPRWLSSLALQSNLRNSTFIVKTESINFGVVERCRQGGPDWHIVQWISDFQVYADSEKGRFYVFCKNKPFHEFYYDTNLIGAFKAV